MKKKVHIVSHSHWDREWYLPFENHRMRLVDLIDGIIEASKDNRFINFQLDGQYLPIEDYLEVKPENREIVYQLVREGKIKVGPWFILQDSFLTSGESNVRNLEIGMRKTEEIGVPAKIGYFPDTFGNIGQAPQILKKAGIDNAYFGRGVKATGFANVVFEDYTSKNSELYWKSPDGSKVLGILFANWYCNGVDIPYETDLLRTYMDKKIEDMEKYASTRHLLLMNGCDHSPVQKNIGEIIEKLNTMYDDYEFVHSDLETYAKEVGEEVDSDELDVVEGELRSQTTDGWGTLTNTSSSRYDLKWMNKNIEMRLEEVVQPLYTMLMEKEKYPYSKIDYVYRHLMNNHPHDSICGCSIDSVHDTNVRRFKDCLEILDYLEDEARIYLSENIINEYEEDYVFTVVNTTAYHQRKIASVKIDFDKRRFRGFEYREIIDELKALKLPRFQVVDDNGSYDTFINDLGVNFGFDLPENMFRIGYYSRQIEVKFMLELDPFERREFRLKELEGYYSEPEELNTRDIETNYYKVHINDNATLDIQDKRTNKLYKNVLMLEDSGDIGNEYIYKQSYDEKIVKSSEMLSYSVEKLTTKGYVIRIHEKLTIPKSAEDLLAEEQRYLVDIKERKSGRSEETVDLIVYKKITIDELSPTIYTRLKLKNNAKDHRLRILFGHDIETQNVYAESIFEVAKREAYPPKTWENPDYSQNLNRFAMVKDENGGFTVSTIGVQEYEQKDEGLYLTLYRSTGEMGDWGHFPTIDSQLMDKEMVFKFNLDFFAKDYYSSWQRVIGNRVPYFTAQIGKTGTKIGKDKKVDIDIKSNTFSTLYRNFDGEAILRIYNPDNITHRIGNVNGEFYNILGTKAVDQGEYDKSYLNPFEIRTLIMEE